ncbi:DUF421 domain-containing protein [Methyloligella solikamskensis]|uniref:DUF421 domain-containing protein n=1 Tax=Methyloligella solikamskensis TaxID=1177756 RepID=A0ABW3J5V7_9HYPH
MDMIDTIFGVAGDTTWEQECARAAVIFFYGLLLIRAAGRRTFGQWSALDVIVSVTAGSALSRALTGNAPLGGTMAAVTVLMGLHWLLAQAVSRSKTAASILEGDPIVLAKNGKLVEADCHRHGVSHADILEALHGAGLEKVNQARLMTLSPNGVITVIPGKAA